jgi:hypothetical protein
MPLDFTNRKEEPESGSSAPDNHPPPLDDPEMYDQREPNKPPAALMGKRWNFVMWLLLALALGGLIALAMVAVSS